MKNTSSDEINSRTLTHIDADGNAYMVDIAGKEITERTAVAEGQILMQTKTFEMIRDNTIQKGDVLTTAKLAGIMAAKRTHELIPLCHPLQISHIDINLNVNQETETVNNSTITIQASVQCNGRTGVEMEALTAVSVTALTIYDMAKAIDRSMKISEIRLRNKTGGQSGNINLP